MKRFLSILLIAICIIGLSACESEEQKKAAEAYKNAAAEMCSQNYETAFTLFSALGDFEDSSARATECSQFIMDALAETAEQDISKALNEKNSDLLIQAILSCQTTPHAQDEIIDRIYSYTSDAIKEYLETTEYESFLWFDSLLGVFHKTSALDRNFVNSMDYLKKHTNMARSAAYMNGKWIRTDNTQNYGLKIETIYDEHQLAFILDNLSFNKKDIPQAHFEWSKGMIMMNDIKLITPDAFTLSCLHLYCYYRLGVQHEYYEDGIGRLDISHNRILTQNTNDRTAEWDPYGDSNIYVRREYYVPPIPLTEDDFTVTFKEPVKDRFEAGDANLSEWFSYQNKAFYVYDLENTTSTSRGISVGSSWDNVVNAYGHGKMNLYQGESDPYFKYLKQSYAKTPDGGKEVSALFSETAQEYMQYELDNFTIRFYFTDDKVSWIFWSGMI